MQKWNSRDLERSWKKTKILWQTIFPLKERQTWLFTSAGEYGYLDIISSRTSTFRNSCLWSHSGWDYCQKPLFWQAYRSEMGIRQRCWRHWTRLGCVVNMCHQYTPVYVSSEICGSSVGLGYQSCVPFREMSLSAFWKSLYQGPKRRFCSIVYFRQNNMGSFPCGSCIWRKHLLQRYWRSTENTNCSGLCRKTV